MPNQFWYVYKADALWSLTILLALVLGKIGIYYFRKWRKRRWIERQLAYTAPELVEERRAELEGRVARVLGHEPPKELNTPHFKCPHCAHRIEVFVLPGLELPRAGGDIPDGT